MSQYFLRQASGRLYPVGETPAGVGREPALPIRLDDAEISRLHASVWVAEGQLLIRDEKSANGTFVNDQRLPPGQPRPLRPGDQLRLGKTVFNVETRIAAQALQFPAAPTRCARCGATQTAGTKFCRQCGAPATAGGPLETVATLQAYCRRCSAPLRPGKRFCAQCGAPIPASPSPDGALRGAPPAPPGRPPAEGSVQGSLGRLGLRVTGGQIGSVVLAVMGGLIMARILPYVYPIFDPILTGVFGSGPSGARDGFNSFMMTAITFATSVGVSVIGSLLFGRPKEKRR